MLKRDEKGEGNGSTHSTQGKQDNEHVIMYYTINMKRRGKFHAEPKSKRKTKIERDCTKGGKAH